MPRSLLHPRRPIRPHRKRRVRLRLHHCVDQKPLPIARHGIGRREVLKSPGAEPEEQERRASFQALAYSHWRRHQLSISRVVDQLTPIPPPLWREPSARRDLPFAAPAREALHVDLVPTCSIRDVGEPPSVWREFPIRFISFRLYHGEWLRLATPHHRQYPDIQLRLWINLAIDDEAPVPRPVVGKFGVIRFPQQRLLSAAAGRLLIEVINSTIPYGCPDDAAPVRRPDGKGITSL